MMSKDRNEAGMKKNVLILFLFALILIFCCTSAICEQNAELQITANSEEWSWDPGAYNQFSGRIDLTDYAGQEITISMSSDLVYGGETDEDHSPLFTVVNGHRITMRKQKSSATVTPDPESCMFDFSASIKLDFRITDGNDNELRNLQDVISARDSAAGRENGTFYIPYDIRTITIAIAAAAAVIWIIVLIRGIITKRYRR